MKILVLGAFGQLGSAIKKSFSSKSNWDLVLTDRNQLDLGDSFEINKKKLTNAAPQVIINCAAYTQVDKAESDEAQAMNINGLFLDNIVKIANGLSSHLIHISTDYVFAGTANLPYAENDICNPLSVYGKSKLLGEQIIQRNSLSYSIFRTSWLYSKEHPSFYSTMLRLANEREILKVVFDQIGSPTSSHSLADGLRAYLIALGMEQRKNLFHFSNEGVCSWFDFAHTIFKFNNTKIKLLPITTDQYPTAATRPQYSVLNKAKFSSELHYDIPHWEQALEKVIHS